MISPLDLYLLRLLTPLQVRISNAVNKVKTEPEDIETALALVDEWGRGFVAEVDYLYAEATNTQEFSDSDGRRTAWVPSRLPRRHGPKRENVLVTEWIDGTRLDVSTRRPTCRGCAAWPSTPT